jgi:hypothetical protein
MNVDPVRPLELLGVRGAHLRALAMGSVGLCLTLWIRAKTVDQEQRGNAERRAVFVGLWPPTLYLIGETLDRRTAQVRAWSRRARRRERFWS